MINMQKILPLRSMWLHTQKMQKKKNPTSVLNRTFRAQISLSVKEGKNPHLSRKPRNCHKRTVRRKSKSFLSVSVALVQEYYEKQRGLAAYSQLRGKKITLISDNKREMRDKTSQFCSGVMDGEIGYSLLLQREPCQRQHAVPMISKGETEEASRRCQIADDRTLPSG